MTRIEFKGRLVQIDHSWNIGPAGPRPGGPRLTYRQNEMDQTLILNDNGEKMIFLDCFLVEPIFAHQNPAHCICTSCTSSTHQNPAQLK